MDGLSKEQKYIVDQIEGMMVTVNDLPEPDKSRCLFSLAYEYYMVDMEEEANKLMMLADVEYFSKQLGEDMDNIDGMKEIVMGVMDKLIEIGIVKIKTEVGME